MTAGPPVQEETREEKRVCLLKQLLMDVILDKYVACAILIGSSYAVSVYVRCMP